MKFLASGGGDKTISDQITMVRTMAREMDRMEWQ